MQKSRILAVTSALISDWRQESLHTEPSHQNGSWLALLIRLSLSPKCCDYRGLDLCNIKYAYLFYLFEIEPHYVVQASFKSCDLSALASWVLGWQTCTIMSGLWNQFQMGIYFFPFPTTKYFVLSVNNFVVYTKTFSRFSLSRFYLYLTNFTFF